MHCSLDYQQCELMLVLACWWFAGCLFKTYGAKLPLFPLIHMQHHAQHTSTWVSAGLHPPILRNWSLSLALFGVFSTWYAIISLHWNLVHTSYSSSWLPCSAVSVHRCTHCQSSTTVSVVHASYIVNFCICLQDSLYKSCNCFITVTVLCMCNIVLLLLLYHF